MLTRRGFLLQIGEYFIFAERRDTALGNGVTSANHSKYLLTRDAFLFCCSLLTFFFQRWMSRIPLEHGCPRDVLMMMIFLMSFLQRFSSLFCYWYYNNYYFYYFCHNSYKKKKKERKKVSLYGYDIKYIDRWNKQIPEPVTSSAVTALKLVFRYPYIINSTSAKVCAYNPTLCLFKLKSICTICIVHIH